MIDDKLNFWLNLWYHAIYLKKCPHKWIYRGPEPVAGIGSGGEMEYIFVYDCSKCDDTDEYNSYQGKAWIERIPNYLSDDSLILEMIYERGLSTQFTIDGENRYMQIGSPALGLWEKMPINEVNEPEGFMKFKRAIMLAYKEDMEHEWRWPKKKVENDKR